MRIRWKSIAILVCLSLSLWACKGVPQQQVTPPTSVASPTPSVSQNTKPAQKVVALSPIAADLLARLDATKLVGIPSGGLLEKDAKFANIPRIGLGQQPNLEKLVELKPDLVVGAEEVQGALLDKIEQLGILTLPYRLEAWNDLADLTEALADSIAADPKPLLDRYSTLVSPLPAPSPSVLVLASPQPILAPNKKSWAGDLLAQFQVNNVAADLQGQSLFSGYITLSPEKVLEVDPDVILVINTPGQDNAIAEFKALSFWTQLKAVKGDRVYEFDYYGLINPGSVEKIEEACARLKQVLSRSLSDPK
jgi:iron complex transport system substrate-binding protein